MELAAKVVIDDLLMSSKPAEAVAAEAAKASDEAGAAAGAPMWKRAMKAAEAASNGVMQAWAQNPDALTEEVVNVVTKATSNASGTQLQDLLSRIESGVAAARRRLDRESGAAGDREVSAVRVDPGPEVRIKTDQKGFAKAAAQGSQGVDFTSLDSPIQAESKVTEDATSEESISSDDDDDAQPKEKSKAKPKAKPEAKLQARPEALAAPTLAADSSRLRTSPLSDRDDRHHERIEQLQRGPRAVDASRGSDEPDLMWPRTGRPKSLARAADQDIKLTEATSEETIAVPSSPVRESPYEPAWKRKDLHKELEEISEIEAHAIAIRQSLQDLKDEYEGADVDAEAAALMLELKGSSAASSGPKERASARHSSSLGDHEAIALLAELHGGRLPEWLTNKETDSGGSSGKDPKNPAERPWHLEVMKMRQTLSDLAKDA
ncbi:Uncharacterized protein SCF082_LOCUS7349 [Durusdinium trenchii]|uniref:Uncharacterized protein n=1 Tax=Durusdinium trenchii TaxID=1381693 RepID=A0ABP0IM84_9DINO